MATISELNVRLGLLYKDFDASLKKVERDLERSGRKFSQLGTDLTLAISAPLAALGAAAIKQAGEIESLKLAMTSTFESAGRSAADAAKEVEALREAAKAPGLDFEQAVKGSIRLQGVGLAAEEARRILSEMANAIASTGGTAEDLDGVTRQFSQMIAKGRVLQEDVSILAERMPVISRLMQQAFGTASVEAIRKAGVTGKEFVMRIIDAAETLPRVEGGIKNAFVNAGAEARNSLAKLGEAIVKSFDVKGKLEAFTNALQRAVKWFTSLSEGAQSTLVWMGAMAIAIGPLIKLYGFFSVGLGKAKVAMETLNKATIVSAKTYNDLNSALQKGAAAMPVLTAESIRATTAVKGLGVASTASVASASKMKDVAAAYIAPITKASTQAAFALRLMNVAANAFVVIGIAAAIYSALDAMGAFTRQATKAQQVQEDLNEVSKNAASSIAKEKSQVDLLIGVIQNETTSRESKLKALEDLRKISPQYFGDLREEEGYVYGLVSAYDAWVKSILQAAKAKAANERLIKIAEEELNLTEQHEQKLQELVQRQKEYADGAKNVQASVGAYAGLGEQQKLNAAASQGIVNAIKQEEEAYKQAQATLKARSDALAKIVTDYEQVSGLAGNVKDKTKELTAAEIEAAEEAAKAAKRRKELYADIEKSIDAVNKKQAELGADFVGEKTKEIEGGVEKLIEAGFAPNSAPVQKLKGYLQEIRAEIAKGFAFSNQAQVSVGVTGTPAAPEQVATLPTPTSVQGTQKPGSTEAIAKALALATEQAIVFDTALIGAQTHWAEWIAQIQASQEYLTTFWDTTGAAMQAVGTAIQALGNAIETSLADSSKSFKQFARDAINAVADVIAALIKQAVAAAIAGAFKSAGNPILGAALAAIGGALAAGLFKKLVGAATYKAFAKGGVITEPTMALMGEYPGARSNPEIVTPERLMRSVFREEAGGAGGKVEVYGVIRGSDIFLSNEKATRDRGRIR